MKSEKTEENVKFKVRCNRYLYTLIVNRDPEKGREAQTVPATRSDSERAEVSLL